LFSLTRVLQSPSARSSNNTLSKQPRSGGGASSRTANCQRPLRKLDFNVLVTPDKNIRYQQNLQIHAISIIVLGNPQWPVLRPHGERVVAAINAAKPGTYCEVDIPEL